MNIVENDGMKIINPAYIEELKNVVKKSPYPRHMGMVLDHIEFDGADITLDLAPYHFSWCCRGKA